MLILGNCNQGLCICHVTETLYILDNLSICLQICFFFFCGGPSDLLQRPLFYGLLYTQIFMSTRHANFSGIGNLFSKLDLPTILTAQHFVFFVWFVTKTQVVNKRPLIPFTYSCQIIANEDGRFLDQKIGKLILAYICQDQMWGMD